MGFCGSSPVLGTLIQVSPFATVKVNSKTKSDVNTFYGELQAGFSCQGQDPSFTLHSK